MTVRIIRFDTYTGILLNGWHLAVEYVWMKEWDERTQDTASSVEVNVKAQRVERIGSNRTRGSKKRR